MILDARGFPAAGAYQRAVHATLVPELRWSQRITRLLYSIGSLAFDPLARSERACNWFAGIVTGEVGYRECFWKAAAGAPFWLLSSRHPVQPVPR